mmetsp:Transcript_6057/g.15437  ORF Transcript_6057/g.15437 Transcript_6057/m.15437 type:complete len:92 (-) Transcript_6057:2829-3104(-)
MSSPHAWIASHAMTGLHLERGDNVPPGGDVGHKHVTLRKPGAATALHYAPALDVVVGSGGAGALIIDNHAGLDHVMTCVAESVTLFFFIKA